MKNEITVLVVDDEPLVCDSLTSILQREGYSVLTASSGPQALEILRAGDVQLVISDVQMPDMNGFELLKAIKNDYPDTGVILMTGFGDTYTVKDALLLGADEYLNKPFRAFEVCKIVERAYWRLRATLDGSRDVATTTQEVE
jgi:DNA-binding NtrC family response regulator